MSNLQNTNDLEEKIKHIEDLYEQIEDLYEQKEKLESKTKDSINEYNRIVHEEIAKLLKLKISFMSKEEEYYEDEDEDGVTKTFDTEEKALEYLQHNKYLLRLDTKNNYHFYKAEYIKEHYNHIVDYYFLSTQSVFNLLKELKNKLD